VDEQSMRSELELYRLPSIRIIVAHTGEFKGRKPSSRQPYAVSSGGFSIEMP